MGDGDPDRSGVLSRWRREVRRAMPSAESDVVEEIALHVADRWRRARDEGRSDAEADGQARAEIDGWRSMPAPARTRRWTCRWLWSGWSSDARYAVRSLRVRPVFTVGAILLSAIAILSNVAAFAIVYGILGRPLPYPESARLAVIWQVRDGESGQVTYPDYRDLREAAVFERSAAMSGGVGSVRIGDAIERVQVLAIEAGGLAMLGATPAIGRLLNDDDADRPLAMISDRLWRTHLGSDPNAVGRVLWVSGRDYTIVGVMPPGFDFELPITPTLRLERQDLWTVIGPASLLERRDVSTYEVLVRLAPATTLTEAQAAVDAVGSRLAAAHPATNASRSFRLVLLKDHLVAPVRRALVLVSAAAGVTLLIALANLITLAIARSADREIELAVRQALGAGALRLRRQLLCEHALVAAVGAAIGTVASIYVLGALRVDDAFHMPRSNAIRVDVLVGLFAFALAGLIAGVLTLTPVRLRDSISTLRAGGRVAGRTARWTRQVTVASQLALAVALSAGGGLFGLSLFRLLSVDPGFSTRGVAVARVSAYAARYPGAPDVQSFFSTVIDEVSRMPGVAGAAASSSLPLSGQTSGTSVQAEGQPVLPGSRPSAGWQFATPGFFAAVGIPLLHGRDFVAADTTHAGHVTIINETLARLLFGDADPIGKRVAVGGGDATGDWHEVIGVVADVRHHALDTAPTPRVYDLFGEHWGRTLFVVARARTPDAAALLPSIRRVVRELDAEAPVFESATTDALVARSAAPWRLAAWLSAALAAAAGLLALIGVYAAAAASVAERTREIGIRAALGAAPADLVRLVVREATLVGTAGALAGFAGSCVAARLLQAQLFGIRPTDVALVIPLAVLALPLAGVAATLPAARRASNADPLIAMRAE